ncbi:MAG: MATE family efflux transporter, partial [Enterovibrio sp.]
GVATTLVYWLMLLSMFVYVLINKKLRRVHAFTNFAAPSAKFLWRIYKLGLPVAASLFFEVTMFAGIALLIAPLGAIVVASHQIAINFSSMVFMLPMSFSTALSIRVSYQLGQKSVDGAAQTVKLGLMIAFCASLITALLSVVFRDFIISLYNDDPAVVVLAANLILISAIYQCMDAVQVAAAGALRGYKDMTAIFKRTFFSYWILGVPIGYILGLTDWFIEPLGVYGFWIGIIIGLTVAAILLGKRLHWIRSQPKEWQLAMAQK